MVIEHTFVTTLEGPDAVAAVTGFLAARGFKHVAPTGGTGTAGFQVAGFNYATPKLVVEAARGVANPAYAKTIGDLPTRVRVEWDRGRVSVAAAVTPKNAKQERGPAGQAPAAGPALADAKPPAAIAGILHAVCRSLELLLWHRDAAAAAAHWGEMDAALDARRARYRRSQVRVRIGLLVFFAVVVLLIVGLYLANRAAD